MKNKLISKRGLFITILTALFCVTFAFGIANLNFSKSATLSATAETGTELTDGGTLSSGDYYLSGNATVSSVSTGSADAKEWAKGVYAAASGSLDVSENAKITATSYYEAVGVQYAGNGSSETPAIVTISGGTIYGGSYGMSGNGLTSYSDVTITGGSITGKYAGLQVCAGTINITGGEFTATATKAEVSESSFNVESKSDDGVIADGAAISIINRSGYGVSSTNGGSSFSDNSISITGGTFTSESNVDALQAYSYTQGKTSADDNENENTVTALAESQAIVTVTGGTYSQAFSGDYSSSSLLNSALAASTDSDGNTVITLSDSTKTTYSSNYLVACVGGTYGGYDSFSALWTAVSSASAASVTVWLNKSVTEDVTIPQNLVVTLDLCGYTLTQSSSTTTVILSSGSTLTISGNGTIQNTTEGSGHRQAIYVRAGAVLVVNDATITGSFSGIRNGKDGEVGGTVILNDGAVVYGASYGIHTYGDVTVNDGASVSGGEFGIAFMGKDSSDYTVVTINGGIVTGGTDAAISSNGSQGETTEGVYYSYGYVKLIINGGTITSESASAIYLPATDGITTISGGTIIGTTGVEIRAGSLTISGDVTITAAGSFSVSANSNGQTVTGAAVAISQHTTEKEITVVITGGTLSGEYAVYETDTVSSSSDQGTIAVELSSGSYSGAIDTTSTNSDGTSTLTISGGTYDETAVSSIETLQSSGVVAANIDFTSNGDGTYGATVYSIKLESASGTTYYTDGETTAWVQALGEISTAGTYTITLGADYTISTAWTIAENYDITLDLNGYTLTITGTDTVLESDYAGIINNGTLTITDSIGGGEIAVSSDNLNYGIYNNGTLTVESGTVSSANTAATSYAVYNASEKTVTVSGGTVSGESGGVSNAYGYVFVTDGEVTATGSEGVAIRSFLGAVTVSGGTVSAYQAVNAYGSTVTISGGSISGTYWGVLIGSAVSSESYYATLTMTGGSVSSDYIGIYTVGEAAISGGTISGATVAILASGTNSVLTIGEEGGNNNKLFIIGETKVMEASAGATVKIYSGTLTSGSGYGITTYNSDSTCFTEVYIYGGNVSAYYFALSGNGSTGDGYINIYIYGGTLTSTSAQAIYNPQQNGVTYIVGGTMTGKTGVEVRSGTVYIGENYNTGDIYYENAESLVVTATGNPLTSESNYNGSTISGAAIAIATYNLQDINLTVGDGVYTSASGYSVYEANVNSTSLTKELTITLTGGTYTGTVYSETASDDNTSFYIIGGTYSTDVSEYAAVGFTVEANSDGTYGVVVDEDYDGEDAYVAIYNGVNYTTLQAAITQAASDTASGGTATVIMYRSVTEDISVTQGNIILDLNGCNITNASGHTITVASGATLTITGDGTVDNVTHAKAAIYNNYGGTVYLEGGSYTRSKEAGSSASDNGGNSYYIIENRGTMYIYDGVTVGCFADEEQTDALGKFSSLIKNGWYTSSDTDHTSGAVATLVIEGGTFIGGLNTVKNDYYGELTINGGTFTNTYQYTVLNWNVATINGGTFTDSGDGKAVICVGYDSGSTNGSAGRITVNGGTFTGDTVITGYNKDGNDFTASTEVTIANGTFMGSLDSSITTYSISGGTFSELPSSTYFADGYYAYLQADGIYTANVGTVVTVPTLESSEFTYTGSDPAYTFTDSSGYYTVTVSGNTVGFQTITLSLNESNYVWSDGTTAELVYTIYISKATIIISADDNIFAYDGNAANVAGVTATTVDGSDATITYTYNGETKTVTELQALFTDVDTYTVYYTVTADNHYDVSGSFTVTINQDTHNYGDPVWSWTRYDSATATFTCTICYGTETVTATITSEITTAATCTESGLITYTAAVTFNGETYTATAAEEIAATGHSYGEPVWTWTDYTSATAKFTCMVCGSTSEEQTVEITSEITTAATCTTAGERTYTATVTFNGVQYTDTKTEAIAALGVTSATQDDDNTISSSVTTDTAFTTGVTVVSNLLAEEEYPSVLTEEDVTGAVLETDDSLENAEIVAVYQISLTDASGKEITVSDATSGGKVTVTTAIPTSVIGTDFYIVHIHNGEVYAVITSDDYTVSNGEVTFTVDNLSEFAFVAGNVTAASSDNVTAEIAWLAVGIVVALDLVIIFAWQLKKRRQLKGIE